VYSREIDGQEYNFGVSGKLIMNVLVMYDRETRSLWSQLLGQAVEGPLEGTKLEFVSSWMTTWSEWKTQHPDTLAIKKGFVGAYDPYASYYASGSAGVINEDIQDDRLSTKEFVIGVEYEDQAIAYPFSALNQEPIILDRIGDMDILVVFNADTGTGVVFNRLFDGKVFTFIQEDGLTLKDEQTGTIWDGITGKAINGPLEGSELSRVKSTASFWFGWKDWYPETEIYGLDP
jgi:hypothetical protein